MTMRPLTPAEIADDAIGLFLEYRDNYGYDEARARAKAAQEIVEAEEARVDLETPTLEDREQELR